MKISFSTLACPCWDLDTIFAAAVQYGFDGLDFRGTSKGVDVTTQVEFTRDLHITKQKIADFGLKVSGFSSGICLCSNEMEAKNLEEAERIIPIALELNAPQVRVFGYGDLNLGRQALLGQGRRCIESILKLDGACNIRWLLETHDNWISSPFCIQFVNFIDREELRILWDIGHTARVGTELPKQTVKELSSLISCVHIKDALFDPSHSQAMEDGWRFRLPGEGQLPLVEAVEALIGTGYHGWYVFEHEKRWHPQLEEPGVALPGFVRWIKGRG